MSMAEFLQDMFDRLMARFGPQGWWPGETQFEVMIGAILTQNTNWGNVEKALTNLKRFVTEPSTQFSAGRMMMKSLLGVLLLWASVALAAGSEPAWSPAVNGLRARLVVLPPEEAGSPFCRVLIEMENVADVAGQMKIRFTPGKLALRVTDETGKNLPTTNGPYDGTAPLWEPTLLPYRGIIKFQISFPGLGFNPAADKVIIDVGSSGFWSIPQDGSQYYLSGSLTVPGEPGDHPYTDWSGSLELPKVKIRGAR